MRKKYIILIIAGIALLTAAAGVFFFLQEQRLSVETVRAERTSVRDTYTENGTLSLGGGYAVIPQVSGAVEEIFVSVNEEVEAGTLLFRIDGTDYSYQKTMAEETLKDLQAQLSEMRISRVMTTSPQEYLKSAEQSLSEARTAFEAQSTAYAAAGELYTAGDISKTAYDQAKASYETAKTAYEQAKNRYEESKSSLKNLSDEGIDESTLNQSFYDSEEGQITAQIAVQETTIAQLEKKLSDCEVRTERAGVVTSLPVQDMSAVSAGTTAAIVSGGGELIAEADVLSSIAPYIAVGSAVEVVLPLRGKDEILSGTVTEVYGYAEKGTSALGLDEYRVHVKAAIDGQEELSGMEGYGVDVRFTLFDEEDCLAVPTNAVFRDGDAYDVYTITGGYAHKTEISVLYQTGEQTVIADGLAEGDTVIADIDSENLYDGAAVKEK